MRPTQSAGDDYPPRESALAAATGRTGPLLVRRFAADYARNPVNLLMLVLVPVVFVGVTARAMEQAAKLLGGPGKAVAPERRGIG